MKTLAHPFYLRHVGAESLLDAEEELELTVAVRDARERLAELVGSLPPDLQQLLPSPPERRSMPQWSFDRISRLRNRLVRLPPETTAAVGKLVDGILEQASIFERARNRLVLCNLRLVVHVAGRYRDDTISMVDLIQEGNLGLMRAIDRFDVARGNRFGTYAFWWIKQGIDRFINEKKRLIRLPASVEELQRQLKRQRQRQAEILGRDPEPEEIAKRAGVSIDRARDVFLLAQQVATVDTTAGNPDGVGWLENIEDDSTRSPYLQLERIERAMHVRTVLKQFSEREQTIVKLRFGIDCDRPHSFQAISDVVKVSRERVRQIVTSVLQKMRKESAHHAIGA